jgi:hypothetical protein
LLAERLVDNKEALRTRLDPVQRDETEHDVTMANSSTHPADQDEMVALEQQVMTNNACC